MSTLVRICVCAASLASASSAQTTTRLSLASNGAQANHDSSYCDMSANAGIFAFESFASNLVPGDTNGTIDVFVREVGTSSTTRVSVDSSGVQGNSGGFGPAISADGRYVTFHSFSSNLVAGDTNVRLDVFVRDRTAGTTMRVSVDSSGGQVDDASGFADISADGRWVVFESSATNLVAGDANAAGDVFRHDLVTGATMRASLSVSQGDANGHSSTASVSNDGDLVAFSSDASNLVNADANGQRDIFLRLIGQAATELISVSSTGAQANGQCDTPFVSADGRFVAFTSSATNLVANDTNGTYEAFVRDRLLATTVRVAVDSNGAQGNASSAATGISSTGRWVAFDSQSNNLVPMDTNFADDAFVHDLWTGAIRRVSVSSSGIQGNDFSVAPVVSDDGLAIAFFSAASNLVSGDTNSWIDLFLHRLPPCSPPVSYCTSGTTGSGCQASITGSGTPSVSVGFSFTLAVSGVEGQKLGMVFYGTAGPQATPWGGGSSWLCVKSPTQRMGLQPSGGQAGQCDGTLMEEWNSWVGAHPAAVGVPFAAGDHVWVQGWFRDPPSPKTTSLSNALYFTVCP